MTLFGYMSSQKVSLTICAQEVSYVTFVDVSSVFFVSWVVFRLDLKSYQELFGRISMYRGLLTLLAGFIIIVFFVDVVVDRKVFPLLVGRDAR